MADRITRAAVAATMFIVLVALAFAASDKPPPYGFAVLIAVLAAVAAFAYWRLGAYLRLRDAGRSAWWRAALEGAVLGTAIGAVAVVLSPGEPSVQPMLIDRIIFAIVLGAIGSVCALVDWLLVVAVRRIRTPRTVRTDAG